jgi:hypothetical protein
MSPKASYKAIRGARRLVLLRDGHWCQMCGRSVVDEPSSIHHRRNKGMGGSAVLERASVLILACGTGTTGCHGWIGREPGHAEEIGWLVRKLNGVDPATVPILIKPGPNLDPRWVLLDDAGKRLLVHGGEDGEIEWTGGLVKRGIIKEAQ